MPHLHDSTIYFLLTIFGVFVLGAILLTIKQKKKMKPNKQPKFKVGQKVKVIATKEQLASILVCPSDINGARTIDEIKPNGYHRNEKGEHEWAYHTKEMFTFPESFLQAID